jgi:hypothetical protein
VVFATSISYWLWRLSQTSGEVPKNRANCKITSCDTIRPKFSRYYSYIKRDMMMKGIFYDFGITAIVVGLVLQLLGSASEKPKLSPRERAQVPPPRLKYVVLTNMPQRVEAPSVSTNKVCGGQPLGHGVKNCCPCRFRRTMCKCANVQATSSQRSAPVSNETGH